MGTEINVTVGPQSLKDRNRQETDANRFRKVEQDAQQRTQDAATDARRQQLAQQGLTADGAAQYGNPSRLEFLRQRPAAFRFGKGGSVCHFWWLADTINLDNSVYGGFLESAQSAIASGDGTVVEQIQYGTSQKASLPPLNVDETVYSAVESLTFSITRADTCFEQYYNGVYYPPSVYYWLTDYPQCSAAYVSNGVGCNQETKTIVSSRNVVITRRLLLNQKGHFARSRLLALPTGNGTCIVFLLHQYQWWTDCRYNDTGYGYGAWFSDANRGTEAYVCSNTAIRSIEIPQKMKLILDIIHPAYTTGTNTINYTGKTHSQTTIPASASGCPVPFTTFYYLNLQGFWNNGLGSYDYSWHPGPITGYVTTTYTSELFTYTYYQQNDSSYWYYSYEEGLQALGPITPSVFARLHNISEFVDGSQIRLFPSNKSWLVELDDEAPTKYSYGFYSVPGVFPGTDESGFVNENLKYRFEISDDLHPDFPDPNTPEFDASFFTVWDWGDPAYCRQMCLALGFSPADLTP